MAVTETYTEPNTLDLATDDIVLETHWDAILSMLTYLARRPEPRFTNKSGGAAADGDVYVVDKANDNAATTTNVAGHRGPIVIARESIANNTAGRYAELGLVSVKVTGTVAKGDYLETSSTPGSARSVGNAKTPGSFAQATTASSGGYCTALLLPTAAGDGVLKIDTADNTVGNTTTETTVLTTTIPANSMGATGVLQIDLLISYLNATGGPITLTIRIKLGATTILAMAPSIGHDAGRREINVKVRIKNTATNVQFGSGQLVVAKAGSLDMAYALEGTGAEDTTADKTLAITVQHSTANASATLKMVEQVVTVRQPF